MIPLITYNYLKRMGYDVTREEIENKSEADILLLVDKKNIISGLPFTPVSKIPNKESAARKI